MTPTPLIPLTPLIPDAYQNPIYTNPGLSIPIESYQIISKPVYKAYCLCNPCQNAIPFFI